MNIWFSNSHFIPRLAAIIKRYVKTQREEDKKKKFSLILIYITENLSKSVQILQPAFT